MKKFKNGVLNKQSTSYHFPSSKNLKMSEMAVIKKKTKSNWIPHRNKAKASYSFKKSQNK